MQRERKISINFRLFSLNPVQKPEGVPFCPWKACSYLFVKTLELSAVKDPDGVFSCLSFVLKCLEGQILHDGLQLIFSQDFLNHVPEKSTYYRQAISPILTSLLFFGFTARGAKYIYVQKLPEGRKAEDKAGASELVRRGSAL